MADSDNHIKQWKHNRAFLVAISPEFPDWQVTAAFYVALHAVDALLAHDRVVNVTSHQQRNGVLVVTNRYQFIWRHYQPLYQLSQTVRYLADPAEWVPADQIQQQVVNRYLHPIEQSVERLMKRDLQFPPIKLTAQSDQST